MAEAATENGRAGPFDEPGRVVDAWDREVVVGGPPGNAIGAAGGYLAAQVYDDVVLQYGPRVYDLMELDSDVAPSLAMLTAAAVGDGPTVSPAESEAPGVDDADPARREELDLAQEIAEAGGRLFARLQSADPPLDETLKGLLGGLVKGSAVAEAVYGDGDGPDAGRWVLATLAVKPRWAYAYKVNRFNRVEALRCWTDEGWRDVSRRNFAIFTWRPKEGDPRGSSLLRPAYIPWNSKLQSYPEYVEFLRHFADPKVVVTAGPQQQTVRTTDANGRVVEKSPAQQNLEAVLSLKNNSALSLSAGSTAKFLESQSGGEAWDRGFDRWAREIFRVILMSARPSQEAKHGSKADTDTGMDMIALAINEVRRPLAACLRRDILHPWVTVNWGKAVADRLTPLVGFGLVEHLKPELLAALTAAWGGGNGLFVEPQRPWLWHQVGAPIPDPEELAALEQQKADRMAQALAGAVAATQPAGNEPPADQGGKANPDGPPADQAEKPAAE
jgi:hypothetical protein